MKMNKNIFICALMVVMMLVCVSAVSAEDNLNADLGVAAPEDAVDLSIDDIKGSEAQTTLGEGSSSGETSVTNQTIVTNTTFFNYFDENGVIKDVSENELTFDGEFSGLGINTITIDTPIILTCENYTIFKEIGFKIISDNVVLNGFDIERNTDGAAIDIKASDVTVSDVLISIKSTGNENTYAIRAVESDNLNLLGNVISYYAGYNATRTSTYQHVIDVRDSNRVNIKKNSIYAELPTIEVNWTAIGIDQDYPLAVGIQNGENIVFEENTVDVVVNKVNAYQTLDAMMVNNVTNMDICNNYFTEIAVNADTVLYLYAVDLYNSEEVFISGNDILVNTTAGAIDKGAAYDIQITGPLTGLFIDSNNLVTISNGNNLGIYASDWAGSIEAYVMNNVIDVTGNVSDDQYGLLSGIEMSANASITGNEIVVKNKNAYADTNNVFGISNYQASPLYNHTFTVSDNLIYADGKYAVYLSQVKNSTVDKNTLYAHELLGDDAAYVAGESSVAENNCPPFVVTNATFYNYFDENNYLSKHVPEGTTLDFQGLFLGNINNYSAYINKPVNIISSTGDAVFEYVDPAGTDDHKNHCIQFNVVAGADNTNITGISIINGDLFVIGASGVTIDNVYMKANMSKIGQSTGFLSIHTGAYNTTVKNSYFENGGTGSSILVLGNGGKYASFDNNRFNITGSSGNVLSANQFVGTGDKPQCVNYTNNVIESHIASSSFMYGITVNGVGNLVENNTLINFKGNGIITQYSSTTEGNVYRNNNVSGSATMSVGAYSIIENNYVEGALTIAEGCIATGNTAKSGTVSGKNAVVDNNTFNGAVSINSAAKNTTFTNNYLKDALTVSSNDNVISDNQISTEKAYAVDLKTTSGNTVKKNILSSADKMGDEAVNYAQDKNNTVKLNGNNAIIEIEAADAWSGNSNIINVTVVEGSNNITIRVNGKEFDPIKLDKDGKATFEIPANVIEVGINNITVTYSGDEIINPDSKDKIFYGLDNVVYTEVFFNYFDEDGILKDDVPYDDLIFKGAFAKASTVQYITIDRPVFISSDAASLSLIGMVIASDNVTIDGLKFTTTVNSATSALGDLITVLGNNVTLTDLDINYRVTRGNYDAIAIDAFGVDGLTISNNKIVFESVIDDDEYTANAINLDGVNNVVIRNNTVTTKLPGLYASNYDWDYFMMGLNTVNPIRIRNVTNLSFTENSIDSGVKSIAGSFPTIQSLFVVGTENAMFYRNNFTMIDTVSKEGTYTYLYAINFGYDKNIILYQNNFELFTKSGVDSSGGAYAIQIVDSQIAAIDNNITTESNGPNLGIYVASPMMGPANSALLSAGNNISVAGYATSKNDFALVSGIEVQNGNAEIYYNNILVVNKAGYVKSAPVHGVSLVQYGKATFDVDFNNVTVNGDYAVYIKSGNEANVTNNVLFAEKYYGDRAVYTTVGIVENNTPMNPYLLVEFDDITVGETAVFNITFDANDTGEVTLIVNGKVYDVNVTNGTGQVNVSGLEANEYTVIAYLTEVAPYGPDEYEAVLTVAKYPTEITIDVADVKAGQNAKVTIDLGNAKATGKVIAIIDGVEKELRLSRGKATTTISNIIAGDHNIVAIYNGDDNCEGNYAVKAYTINKTDAIVTVNVTDAKVYEPVTITVNVTEGATGIVLIAIGEDAYSIDLDDGNVLEVIIGEADVYNVTAYYMGDDLYYGNFSDVVTLNITEKASPNIKLEIPDDIKVGDVVVINATADSPDLTVFIDDEPQEIVNGTITFIADEAGVYRIIAISLENEDYESDLDFDAFEITKRDATVKIDIPENVTIGDLLSINITSDSDAEIIVYVDGNEVTLDEGKVYLAASAGTHTIFAGVKETDEYYAADCFAILDVEKLDSAVNVIVENARVGEIVPITVNVTEGAKGYVIVYVGEDEYLVVLDETNVVEVVINNADSYDVIAYYMGDSFYYGSTSDAVTLNITAKEVPDVTVELPLVSAGNNATVTVSIPNATGVVEVFIDGKNATIPLDENGTAEYTIPDIAAGEHSLVVLYSGDTDNDEAIVSKTFEVVREYAEVNVTIGDIAVGKDTNISVSVPDATGNVSVIVDGKETAMPLDENGSAVVPVSGLAAGDHSVVVIYSGDDTHDAAYVVKEIKQSALNSAFTSINVSGDGYISAILMGSDGKAIGNALVTYTLNGIEGNATTSEDGELLFKAASNTQVIISYAGNETVLPSNVSLFLENIAPTRTATAIVGDNYTQPAIEYYGGERGGNFTVQLFDQMGNPLANKTVYIGYNGKCLNRTTDENGYASVQINLVAENRLTFAVAFLGDEYYNATMSVYLITITKKAVTISAPAKTYKASAKTKSYTVTLKTDKNQFDGKTYFGSGKKVTLKVNGKTYTAKTNSKGQATFKLDITKKGTYIAEVSYAGDNTYKSAKATAKIKIN